MNTVNFRYLYFELQTDLENIHNNNECKNKKNMKSSFLIHVIKLMY